MLMIVYRLLIMYAYVCVCVLGAFESLALSSAAIKVRFLNILMVNMINFLLDEKLIRLWLSYLGIGKNEQKNYS